MPIKRRVFVSFQNPELLDERRQLLQEQVIKRIEELDLQPEMFFRAGAAAALAWSLQNAVDTMRRCVGAVVVAFPRWEVPTAQGDPYKLFEAVDGGVSMRAAQQQNSDAYLAAASLGPLHIH